MDKLERVRQLVTSAFDSVPIPNADDIIMRPCPGGQGEHLKLRRALTGKNWRDVANADWYSFWSLTPEAYQHYLPAQLMQALDAFDRHHGIGMSIRGTMGPSDIGLYWTGKDEDFNKQVSLFTPEQFKAVAAFLALNLSTTCPQCKFMASRRYRFGWHRFASPERALFMDFDNAMRNWQYPESSDPEIASLVRELFTAFADTPQPGDQNMGEAQRDDEPAGIGIDFRHVDWRQAHPYLLAAHYSSLSFFTSGALRYFLPAYLVTNALGLDGESNADPQFSLTHGFCPEPPPIDFKSLGGIEQIVKTAGANLSALGIKLPDLKRGIEKYKKDSKKMDWRAYAIQRMAGFNLAERRAIVHYLEYRANIDEFSADDINAALQNYWLPSIENYTAT